MRDPRIYLAGDEARCEPSDVCAVRQTCARGMAPIPARYAVMCDFSLGNLGGTALCPGKVAIQRAPDGTFVAPVKPWPGD